MSKWTLTLLLVAAFLMLAGPALGIKASPLEQWQPKELSELPGMSTAGVKFMLGSSEVDGVRSVAYLNDVRQQMAKYGLKQTHHIMVFFNNTDTEKAIETGVAKVLVVNPDGKSTNSEVLFAMDGGFGADVTLTQKGRYRFEVRALLLDGKERIFQHFFVN